MIEIGLLEKEGKEREYSLIVQFIGLLEKTRDMVQYVTTTSNNFFDFEDAHQPNILLFNNFQT